MENTNNQDTNAIIEKLTSDIKVLNEELKKKDDYILELKGWINELEKAKKYFLDQIQFKDKEIARLEKIARECESREDKLVNETKKLRFYLKEEIRKPWYKKLLNKGSIYNYKLDD